MARGQANILFGKPLIPKKSFSGQEVIKYFTFPADPRVAIANEFGFFMLDKQGQVYSLDKEGGRVAGFDSFVAQGLRSGQGPMSLTTSAFAWLSENGSVFYKTIYRDMHLEPRNIVLPDINQEIINLQAARGNGLFLVTKEKEQGENLWQTHIDPIVPLDANSWKPFFSDEGERGIIERVKTSPEGLAVFSRHSNKDSGRARIDWIPVEDAKRSWRFLDLDFEKEDNSFFLDSQRVVFHREEMIYISDKQVQSLQLQDTHGERKILFQGSGAIEDIALDSDRLAVLEEKTLTLLSPRGEKIFSFDIEGQGGRLLVCHSDLFLWRPGKGDFLAFPGFFAR